MFSRGTASWIQPVTLARLWGANSGAGLRRTRPLALEAVMSAERRRRVAGRQARRRPPAWPGCAAKRTPACSETACAHSRPSSTAGWNPPAKPAPTSAPALSSCPSSLGSATTPATSATVCSHQADGALPGHALLERACRPFKRRPVNTASPPGVTGVLIPVARSYVSKPATILVQRFNSAEIQVAYLAMRDCGRADCRRRPAQA